ncbi:MAG: alpha/beta fold hydrolase [Pseudomonadota bacterium]
MGETSKSDTLVYVVHGLRGSKKKLSELIALLEFSYPDSDVRVTEFAHRSLFSSKRATEIVTEIIEEIDQADALQGFKRIILVGHSMGAVLARRVLIEASGTPHYWPEAEPKTSKREQALAHLEARSWAKKIERLVMFASISRGWSATHTKSPLQSFQWNLGGMVGHLLPSKRRPTLFDFRLGSPFIVQTRLRWLDYCRTIENRPQVVQFLGTKDDVAPPNDTIDFATAKGPEQFIQVELPHSSHSNMLKFYVKIIADSAVAEQTVARRDIVQGVLTDDLEAYEDHIVKREWFSDELPAPPDADVDDLVFVIHGIRDRGFWTKKIAARIKEHAAEKGVNLVSRTPSYGYFAILPFLLPWVRRQKVEWFMDQYVEAAAIYPEARMHFLGHSNGTYLAARALNDYPAISFKRIFFAGSVVRRNFEWAPLVGAKRVEKIFNVVATADWVVAIFPYGLRPFQKFFDLGGAGHVGFETPVPKALYQMDLPGGPIGTRDYVEGGHSAGREEELWKDIANFFVTGDVIAAGKDNPFFAPEQKPIWRFIGKISPALVGTLATLIIGFGVFSIWATGIGLGLWTAPEWSTDSAFWSAWFEMSAPGHLIVLGLYAAFLRFMAIRF